MIAGSQFKTRRRAAALIETAAVMIIFLMFLFGILEYCRFLFVQQLLANSAREGARFAVVNTNSATLEADVKARVSQLMGGQDAKMRNFTIRVYRATTAGARDYTYNPTGGLTYGYETDATGKYIMDSTKTKQYIQKDATGEYLKNNAGTKVYLKADTNQETVTGVNAASFNTLVTDKKLMGVAPATDAAFGQYIAVEIECDYDPIVPVLLLMPKTLHVQTKALMYSEAN